MRPRVDAGRWFGAALAAVTLLWLGACDRHPPESPRTAVAQTEPYAGDPHRFACDGCHKVPPGTAVADWRPTCTRSGCHPQAWTRTIFHRVDPATFSDCTNCHKPHVWVADGDDCRSCHATIHGPEGTVTALGVAGTPLFPHDRHSRIECSVCHTLETRHADLLLARSEQCTACHHGPPAAASCTTCHGVAEIAGARSRPTQLELEVWPAPRLRTLPFDHARHDRIECTTCHSASRTWAPADNCSSCHTEHHRSEAACIDCHARPAGTAHTLDVHTGSCRECHGPESAARMQRSRNFCLVCHQDQVDHMPAGNCADCHKLAPESGATP